MMDRTDVESCMAQLVQSADERRNKLYWSFVGTWEEYEKLPTDAVKERAQLWSRLSRIHRVIKFDNANDNYVQEASSEHSL